MTTGVERIGFVGIGTMGLPIGRLMIGTNANDILVRTLKLLGCASIAQQ